MIDVELYPIEESKPCEVCKVMTNAFVPEYDAWLCFPCFQGLTAVIVGTVELISALKETLDAFNQHQNN